MTTALLLVDIQNDFCPGGSLAVPQGDQVVGVANAIQARFDIVVASKDWHPVSHGSFAANHAGASPGQVIDLHGLQQILWPVHCVEGSRGAQFVDGLETSRIDCVFQKGTNPEVDSYSAFYDNGRRQSTGMTEWLRGEAVDTVYVMGLATDYCVKFTALDAASEGFKTILIADGCRGVNLSAGDSEAAMDEMTAAGITIINSSEVP